MEVLDADALAVPPTYRVIGAGTEKVCRGHCPPGRFNHRTNHRGKIVAALNQDGCEPPSLNLIFDLDEFGLTG